MTSHPIYPLVAIALLLSACSEHEQHRHPPALGSTEPVERVQDEVRIARGERIFAQYCVVCHGVGAVGDENWRYRDDSGHFPPPPLNGTAHAWHHPWEELHQIIRDGQNNMPAWGTVLSSEEIDDTIHWFQSLWPDEVYQAWYRIDQRGVIPR